MGRVGAAVSFSFFPLADFGGIFPMHTNIYIYIYIYMDIRMGCKYGWMDVPIGVCVLGNPITQKTKWLPHVTSLSQDN